MKIVKYIIYSVVVVFFGFLIPLTAFHLAGGVLKILDTDPVIYLSEQEASLKSLFKDSQTLSLVFVGDVMLDRGVEASVAKNAEGDFSFLFEKTDFIKDADIAFGNLEGPIADAGKDLGKLYSFRFKPDAMDILKKAGFDVFSIANNHIADWGEEAFLENLSRLKNEGILAVGGDYNRIAAETVKIIKKNGLYVGFLAFTDVGPDWFRSRGHQPGILIVDDNMPSVIEKASKEVDVLVVSFHFGEEYETVSNERQQKIAHLAIDSGAKIVVGHHPHVIQEVEEYNNGIIAYSLGNFIFDQNFSEETMEGMVFMVYLENGELISSRQGKIKLNEHYQPELVD
ncbi:MAG: CapA family protein [Patescibacteria group bacterium]